MNKPPVMSDEEIIEWIIDNKNASEEAVKKLLPPLAWSLEAQRDADVEWFEKNIGITAMKTLPILIERERTKARQDTAREILVKIESWAIHGWLELNLNKDTCWQALKAEHLPIEINEAQELTDLRHNASDDTIG